MSDRTAAVQRLKPRKHVLMFALSIVLGAGGVFFSKRYIEEQIATFKSQFDQNESLVMVVVPTRALARGEILSPADVQQRQVPATYVDGGNVLPATVEVAYGQRIDFAVERGKPLLWAHLEGGLTPTFSGKVQEGLRAMTVRVDEINSISGFLQPKDRVDLLLTLGSGEEQTIRPLIERLDVIATGTQTLVDKQALSGKRSFTTITVHVSPAQAQRITLAQGVGKLTAMLRNPEDESPLSDGAMTVAEMLGLIEPAPPEPAPARKPRPRVSSEPGIEYIIGGSR